LQINYKLKIFLLVIVLATFIAGLAQLFILRFETGDIYPLYSSLRADPLGTKAFYESLGNLPGIEVVRNYAEEDKIANAQNATFFYFGLQSHNLHYLPESDVKMLENIASGGGRIVLCLLPQTSKTITQKEKEDAKKVTDKKDEKKSEKTEKDDRTSKIIELTSRWKFNFGSSDSVSATKQAFPATSFSSITLHNIYWHSLEYFTISGSDWISVFEVNGHPVIIEKIFGRGSIVLATDSYFVSNEALVKERHPELLVWLAGSSKKIVFDETHLGLRENKGIVSLLRKYQLHGIIIAIIVLGILFIWKNMFSLVPADPDEKNNKDNEISTGKDYLAGFVGMLRRAIPPADLLSICFTEWEKTIKHVRKIQGSKKEKLRSLIAGESHKAKGQKIIAVYNEASKILAEREYK
jgi:hypothetical protein